MATGALCCGVVVLLCAAVGGVTEKETLDTNGLSATCSSLLVSATHHCSSLQCMQVDATARKGSVLKTPAAALR